jgi:hypothetical protein
MELFAEILSALGALLLGVSCGVLVEELVFGGLVRLLLAQRPKVEKTLERNEQKEKGERPCLR